MLYSRLGSSDARPSSVVLQHVARPASPEPLERAAAIIDSHNTLATLHDEPTVLPVVVIEVAINLKRRGFRMSLDQDQRFQIQPATALTEADLSGIHRWRLHLGAIIGYDAERQERTQ